MPPLQGEERMLTVFADVHSYFTEPTPKPIHHRFDKGSYLYIYHDAAQHKSRIEVANNPGTPFQDAFNGALDRIHIDHSTRFPTLCTVTVDGPDPNPQAFPPPPNPASLYEWRLPSSDQNDLFRLHTLDVYFWTQEDVDQFLDVMEHILSPSQIASDRHPQLENHSHEEDHNNISSVVQQLENVAVTDPAYQNGQTRNSRTEAFPTSNTTPVHIGMSTFPPPPPSATLPPAPAAATPSISPTQQATPCSQPSAEQHNQEPAQGAPLPYNPAAPAAPEPIQHREKTPPPADGVDGTGLQAAVAADHGIPYTPPSQTPGAFAPPPTQPLPYSMPGSYASPPPSAGLPPSSAPGLTHSGSLSSRSSSVQSPPGASLMPAYAASPSSPFFPGNVQQPQQASRTGSLSFAPPPQSQPQSQVQLQAQPQAQAQTQDPNSYLQLQQLQQQYLYNSQNPQAQLQLQLQLQQQQQQLQQKQQQQQLAPAAQIGAFSIPNTNEHDPNAHLYAAQQQLQLQQLQQLQQQQPQQQTLSKGADSAPTQKSGKLENRAARVESGVNRFLKKLEKRL
ncbi:uncharacterized protein EURHEDRAFT_407664 [Aspergillus ruber CBS 135680]|uniref:RNA recognition motif-containing protein n=1 Tax=Aspergillus ruber (strain CBS 135680) TaxID=1388766 RepID=A0A017SRS1_ASPRC|nr:uncharacterized protein EURHEDRAFT_407664 [Aspergillus ruber CBS 135680]EYE99672.1 hypothetical protein EURHEDRAFT_407664 [Aspergillus ruber CBS 135680]